ncbi:MAG: phosphomethylpyrimidine synthase ThiC, partial [Firmicutes bacterium]|nr:phosphomethylpyrimidine synthase ThiC [Bacillota bacterium]
MTQVLAARAGKITPEMETAAAREGLDVELIRQGVASGKIVIPKNINRKEFNCCGIGHGLKIKVNALIGTSSDLDHLEMEARKLAVAREAGCDAVMDLSTGGDIDGMRRQRS